MDEITAQRAGRDFVALCYEMFLGREADATAVIEERGRWPVGEVLESFLTSEEFERQIYRPLETGRPFNDGLYAPPLQVYHRYWVLDRLPISAESEEEVRTADSWRSLLACLVADERLMALGSLPPLACVPLTEAVQPEDGPEPFSVSPTPFDPRRHALVLHTPQELWG